jgi:hypothetical protein
MKKHLLTTAISLALAAGMNAQILKVADITTEAGTETNLLVRISGYSDNVVNALQFNLSLPDGVSFDADRITVGSAAKNHTVSTRNLSNGDLLVVLYNMDLEQLNRGGLINIPVTAAAGGQTYECGISVGRMAGTDAVSQTIADASFTITTSADNETIENGIIYACDATSNSYSVTGFTSGVPATLTLASSINGGSVTSIAAEALKGCTAIENLTIPASVTSIGASAFENCTSLETVEMPAKIYTGQEAVFQGCTSLTSVTLPSKLKTIGTNMFSGCTSLQSISIPETVTNIKYGAFRDCSSLSEINIPDGVTSIKDNLFYGCSSLESIELHSGITSISTGAFSGCKVLGTIDIPEGCTSIGTRAFLDCANLTSIHIPETVTSLGDRVFSSTSILKDIYITPYARLIYSTSTFDVCTAKTLHLVRTNSNSDKIDEIVNNCTGLFKEIIIEDALPFCLNVGDDMFATLYLDHAVSIPTNVIAVFYCKALSGNKVKMYRQTSVIPAYTAVVVMANSGKYYFPSTQTNKRIYGNILQGVIEDTDVTDLGENVLTFSSTTVMGFYSGLTDVVKANTAYVSSGDINVKELLAGFDEATGIEGISAETDDAYYTLQGIRVETPVKGGIYIRSGKKVLVK